MSITTDGCDVAPHCLSCPLPQCKYDDPAELRRMRRAERAAAIDARIASGMSAREIAADDGINVRTVYRTLRGVGEEG